MLLEHLAQDPEERDEVDAARPAVHHRAQLWMRRGRIEAADERRRLRPHDREQRRDRVDDAADPPERQRRRAEAGDLAIRRIGERPHQVDGIGRRLLAVVVGVKRIEPIGKSNSDSEYGAVRRTAPDVTV